MYAFELADGYEFEKPNGSIIVFLKDLILILTYMSLVRERLRQNAAIP